MPIPNHYQKNLEAIEMLYPQQAEWIREQPEIDWIKPIKSDGKPNLLVKTDASKWEPAYDTKNVFADVDKAAKSFELFRQDCTIILGFGCGHLPAKILEKAEQGHHVFVVEPVGAIIREALKHYDYTKWIKDKKLILCAPGKDELVWALNVVEGTKATRNWYMLTEPYAVKRAEEYGELAIITGKTINQMRCNTGTVCGAGKRIADNDIQSLPFVIRHRGVKELEGLYKGKPAICVSTGPSLSRNVHLLSALHNKAIIVCVGQALRPLLGYGITPDFATTVDFGEVNYTHFKGLMDCGVPLVCLNRAYAPLLRDWQGPKFVVATPNPGYEETAHGILHDKGFLDQGGSVAHMSLQLARHLGCDPIMLVGQDLALTDKSHIGQADANGTIRVENGMILWHVKDPRSHLHDKIYPMGPETYVPGYYGEKQLTNNGLASFLNIFERMIEGFDGKPKVLNCTEGGAWIKGASHMWLDDAAEKYCDEEIDKSSIEPLLSLAEDGDKLVEKVKPLLQEDVKTLENIIKHARGGLKSLTGMVTASRKGNKKKLRQLLKVNEEQSKIAYMEAMKIPLMQVSLTGANQEIQMREMNIKTQVSVKIKEDWPEEKRLEAKKKAMTRHLLNSDNTKDLQTLIKRNRHILTTARNTAQSLKKDYKETLKIIDDPPQPEPEPIDLSDADKYFDEGKWAHPLLEAKRQKQQTVSLDAELIASRALDHRHEETNKSKKERTKERSKNKHLIPQYLTLTERAHSAGREKPPNFDKAIELLNKAKDLLPERENARWGLASALRHLKRTDEAIEEYNDLVKLFPDNPDYTFERGLALVDARKIQEALKDFSTAMQATEKFDGFLPNLAQLRMDLKQWDIADGLLDMYLEKTPHDPVALEKKVECLKALGKDTTKVKKKLEGLS